MPAPLIDRQSIGVSANAAEWAGWTRSDVSFTFAISPPGGFGAARHRRAGGRDDPSSPEVLTLLDLSTSADLFGVQIEGIRDVDGRRCRTPDTGFVGLSLAISDAAVAVFALPRSRGNRWSTATSSPPCNAPTAGNRRSANAGPGAEHRTAPTSRPWCPWRRSRCCSGPSAMSRQAPRSGAVQSAVRHDRQHQPDQPTAGQSAPELFTLEGGHFALCSPTSPPERRVAAPARRAVPDPTEYDGSSGSTTLSVDGPAPGYGIDVLGSEHREPSFSGEFSEQRRRAPAARRPRRLRREHLERVGRSRHQGHRIIKVQFETIVGRTAYRW